MRFFLLIGTLKLHCRCPCLSPPTGLFFSTVAGSLIPLPQRSFFMSPTCDKIFFFVHCVLQTLPWFTFTDLFHPFRRFCLFFLFLILDFWLLSGFPALVPFLGSFCLFDFLEIKYLYDGFDRLISRRLRALLSVETRAAVESWAPLKGVTNSKSLPHLDTQFL